VTVGFEVGASVGTGLGIFDGFGDGTLVGTGAGTLDGEVDGLDVGSWDGCVGCSVSEGVLVGTG